VIFIQWFSMSRKPSIQKVEAKLNKITMKYQLHQEQQVEILNHLKLKENKYKLLAKQIKKAQQYEQYHLLKSLNHAQIENIRQYRMLKNKVEKMKSEEKLIISTINNLKQKIKELEIQTV
jgi:chromosome segregation ATPase